MSSQKTSINTSNPAFIAGVALIIFGVAVAAGGLFGGLDRQLVLLGGITSILGVLVAIMWGKYGSVQSTSTDPDNTITH